MDPSYRSLNKKYRAKAAYALFQGRLIRNGKFEEFWQARANREKTLPQLRKEFGYVSVKDEFEQERTLTHLPVFNRHKERMAEAQRNKGRSGLDKAFDALPNRAAADQELSWVQSHPKMRRALHDILRGEEDIKPPKITVLDITGPSNGACPSKTAFNMLLSWLASPKEFQKQLLAKQRDGAVKSGEGSAEAAGTVSDDLGSLKRIHDQFLAQQKAAS